MKLGRIIGKIKRDKKNREIIDPNPVAPPIGWRKPLSIEQRIRDTIRHELSEQANDKGFESFEEADDFDVDEDVEEFTSPYEQLFDPEEFPASELKSKFKEEEPPKAEQKTEGSEPPPSSQPDPEPEKATPPQ